MCINCYIQFILGPTKLAVCSARTFGQPRREAEQRSVVMHASVVPQFRFSCKHYYITYLLQMLLVLLLQTPSPPQ
jgi:hypothetical protein